MKKINIEGVLALSLLTAASAFGWTDKSNGQIVYCKAVITDCAEYGETRVAVTLPPTEGYYDDNGDPVTVWNVGEVVAGGVADSWHSDKGPGAFTAHNTGNVGAYVYLTTGARYCDFYDSRYHYIYGEDYEKYKIIFGMEGFDIARPVRTDREMWNDEDECYRLAWTTDVTAKVPTWHQLDAVLLSSSNYSTGWNPNVEELPDEATLGSYMGYLSAGDYLPFDLKFWAPKGIPGGTTVFFTFRIEVATFKLWEHDTVVE